MKKATTLFAAILLLAVGATAQKLSYQAVVRNNANELVTETTVQVAVTVLNANNAVQYAETHANVQTNRNGLLSLMIGDGVPTGSATLAGVEWPGASLRTVITLPDNTTITNVTPVNSVPYALYADNVDPNMVSNAIAEYIANHNIGGEDNVQADWNESNQSSDAYIWNKPDIPTVPTDVSAFNNDAGYLTEAQCNGVDICSLLNMMATLQQQVDNVQDQNTNLQHRLDSLQTVMDTMNGVFVCGVSTVTDHEGNVYNTVKIGNQCWTKENLRTTTSPSTGTYLIPTAGTGNTYTGKQARWYNNNSAMYAPMNFGLLYNWNAAVDTFNTAYGEMSLNTSESNAVSVTFSGHRRGICPAGWHLPSDAEWTVLRDYVGANYACGGSSSNIAKALASTIGWNTSTDNCTVGNDQSLNNASGFGVVPAGLHVDSSFDGAGYGANFWSAPLDASSPDLAKGLFLLSEWAGLSYDFAMKSCGFSVRCLRDSIPSGGDTPVPQDTTTIPVDTTTTDGQPCPGTLTVTDHEGNIYNTVQIGNQCWTKENLRTTTSPSTGMYLIPPADADYTYTGKQARWYNNDSATYASMNYGLLYNWNAAVDTFNTAYGETSVNIDYNNAVSVNFSGHRRGICPVGWHLPSDAEWSALIDYVGSVPEYQCGGSGRYIAKALASETGWNSYGGECYPGDQSQHTNNTTGFSAVPAGGCYGSSSYDAGYAAIFRSSTQYNMYASPYHYLYYSYLYCDTGLEEERYTSGKESGWSVRCLRD